MKKQIIVIGGGPAGMMAAYQAAKNNASVILLEQNEKLGKKLFITGKGRCNVTNDSPIEDFFAQIPRNPKFLYSALYGFSNDQLRILLEQWGVSTKVERGERVFPVSDKSSDVIRAFSEALRREQVRVRLQMSVESLVCKDGKIQGVRLHTGEFLEADAVIIACGGASYPRTGSTGQGYTLARSCGHHVTNIMPSLVAMNTLEMWPEEAQGLSLRNVTLTAKEKNKIVFQEMGEMIFTHFGISGPLVLSCSAHIELKNDPVLSIDLKPALSEEKLHARLQREIQESGKRQYRNLMQTLLPTKLIPIFVELTGILPEKHAADLSREDRNQIVSMLKGLDLHIKAFRSIDEAIITRGGVETKEINPSTMESKLVDGLYFAGEVMDVDAYTGGFNLQIAFSTGYLAGESAAKI